MKCPNCSAECADDARECDFCGHPFVESQEQAVVTPPAPPSPTTTSQRAVYTASEPTYTIPETNYTPPPTPPDNPYAANYPSSGRAPRESYRAGSVPNYLVWAILATLCCCLPAGIVAIVYAAQVDGKLAAGDYDGALASSKNAKMWSWISFGAAGVIFVLYFLLIMAGGMADPGRY